MSSKYHLRQSLPTGEPVPLPKRSHTTFEELTQMMVKLGFESEWNQMNEAAGKEVEEEAQIGDNEDGDGFFKKQRKLYEGLLEEAKGTMEYFQEGLLKAPAEKAEIEMTLDYLQGEVEDLEERIAEAKLEEQKEQSISGEAGEDDDDWVFV